ncbi:MAG: C-terminal processing protease CtpA/Prc, contains a PDZ domain [Chloroflexi bacterium]|nr:MAG: C-terminal processing protease CtpA/Prc, contains a PDZ domain [Chloroflexota bacterium]
MRQTGYRVSIYIILVLLIFGLVQVDAFNRRNSEQRVPSNVPAELSGVWEAYKILETDFGGVTKVDSYNLIQGALRGLIGVIREKRPSLDLNQYDTPLQNLDELWALWADISLLLKNEGIEIGSSYLEEAAIEGMLEALGDKNTAYLSADRYERLEESFESDFEGIGIWAVQQSGETLVSGVIEGTPAEKAGILAGDVIAAVDGVPIADLAIDEVVAMIKGPKGTNVNLLVNRWYDGKATTQTLTVARDLVRTTSVIWNPLTDDVAYMKIDRFRDMADQEVVKALNEILAGGFGSLILDVRGNTGGLVSTAVSITSQFLTDGLVIYHVDGQGSRTDSAVKPGGIATEMPLVVLTDRLTASSSEFLAGALQDRQRAKIVGSKTFGKGSLNELRRLDNGSGMYITSALWYTPNGRLIEGKGLEPDIYAEYERWITLDAGVVAPIRDQIGVSIMEYENGIFDVFVDRPLQVALEQLQI